MGNYINVDEPILVREVPKVLGIKISGPQLFALLRYYKVFSKYNIPEDLYIEHGLFVYNGQTPRVTESGVLFIRGMLDYIEEHKRKVA